MGWTMFIFRNSFVHVGSWAAFIGCAFWAYSEPGYEPIIGLVLGVVGIASNQQPLPFFGKKGRSLTPEQKIALRDKWRPIFKAYFLQAAKEKYFPMSSFTTSPASMSTRTSTKKRNAFPHGSGSALWAPMIEDSCRRIKPRECRHGRKVITGYRQRGFSLRRVAIVSQGMEPHADFQECQRQRPVLRERC